MSKVVRKSKNVKKSQKITFFKKSENFENNIVCREKNAIFSVLQIEEISLGPEIFSPAFKLFTKLHILYE